MKPYKAILSVLILVMSIVGCKNANAPEIKTITTTASKTKAKDPNATYAKAQFTVNGMTCAVGCAATIEKRIANMDGVTFAKVDFDKKLAMVEYDTAKVTPNTLKTTVTNVAKIYEVTDMKTVDTFLGAEAKVSKCEPGCKKACCTSETSTKDKKVSCKADCKAACCVKKSA